LDYIENRTSTMADIVIPAKNFFEKNDVRLSYAHYIVSPMRKNLLSLIWYK